VLSAVRASRAVRAAVSCDRIGARSRMGSRCVRGAGAVPRTCVEVPRGARGGRRDGRADRRGCSARSAGRARGPRPGAHACGAAARSRLRPRRASRPGACGPNGASGRAIPDAKRRADPAGRILARRTPRAWTHRGPGPWRSTVQRRARRRRAHHRRDARGVRAGAATNGRLHGVCGRLCAGVELIGARE